MTGRRAIVTGAAAALATAAPAANAMPPAEQLGANDARLLRLERRWHHLWRYVARGVDDETSDRVQDLLSTLERRIAATPADSVHGIAARARIYLALSADEWANGQLDDRDRQGRAMCEDLARLTAA